MPWSDGFARMAGLVPAAGPFFEAGVFFESSALAEAFLFGEAGFFAGPAVFAGARFFETTAMRLAGILSFYLFYGALSPNRQFDEGFR